AGGAVSAPVAHGGDPLWRRWQVFRSALLDLVGVNLVYAGAKKQKVSNSDARESRAVTQVQRREDVNVLYFYHKLCFV
ncbi:hypothetical protein, partial [Okeania sp. SIO2B3]|uniref:hypothetical protein n=1 Tax=Okeania sp. SIO2B3 TaxID=2607784 RepID=UPI0025E2FBC9